ncbi:hypothetical protein D3C85_1871940 [compost metagenome]
MAEQHGDAVVIADPQKGVGGEDLALILGAAGKTMGTGNDKRHHQTATQPCAALEKTAAR